MLCKLNILKVIFYLFYCDKNGNIPDIDNTMMFINDNVRENNNQIKLHFHNMLNTFQENLQKFERSRI